MTIREELEAARTAELITVRQLALLSQYSTKTIYRKVRKGEIPGLVQYGRGIRFMRVVALAWQRKTRADRDLTDAT